LEKTLVKGLKVLEALVERGGYCGVSDLAASVNLSKSNAHRLLNTLVKCDFAVAENGRYAASLRVWELCTRVLKRYDIRQFARPSMERLAAETAESVRLAVLDKNSIEVIYIDRVESSQFVRIATDIGDRAPAHCTSGGKVLLAFQDEDFISAMSKGLKAYTPNTITDPKAFIRHLRKVRKDGYALNLKEYSMQARAASSPIFGIDGKVVAALSIAAPAGRVSAKRLQEYATRICDAAMEISARMQMKGAADAK
jgi:DNA-binding IclR family transcriptional regulator